MTQPKIEPSAPSSFRELIARWARTRDFARDAGCSPLLVRQWRHRNFVPAQYWPGIVSGAARRGIGGVDADLLAHLAATLRGRRGQSGDAVDRTAIIAKPGEAR